MASNVFQFNISKKDLKKEKLARIKKLVAEVRKRECLYIGEKASKEAIDKAWQEVARKVGAKAVVCKEKWKNMQTAYVNYVNGPLNANTKPYYLAEELKFLDPDIMSRQPNVPDTKNINESDDNSDQSSNESYFQFEYKLPDLEEMYNNQPCRIPSYQTYNRLEQDRNRKASKSQVMKNSVQSCAKRNDSCGYMTEERGFNEKERPGITETIKERVIKRELIDSDDYDDNDDHHDYEDDDKNQSIPTDYVKTEFNLSGQSHSPVVQEDKQKNRGSFNKSTLATSIKKRKRGEENPRELYLLSLLPDIQMMSDKQMRTFKSKVSVIVEKILKNDGDTSEIKEEI